MSRYGYLEVFQSPFDFEITRVDCISNVFIYLYNRRYPEMPGMSRSAAFSRHQKKRDEEQLITKQTQHMKPPTHKVRLQNFTKTCLSPDGGSIRATYTHTRHNLMKWWFLMMMLMIIIGTSVNIYILAEKRNASINSGVVFLKKIVDFIWLFIFLILYFIFC